MRVNPYVFRYGVMPLQNSPAAVTPPIGYALRSSPPTPLTLLQSGPYNWNASWALREKYIVPVRWQDGYERVQTVDKSPNLGGQLFMPEATPRVISRDTVYFEIFLRKLNIWQYPISGIWQDQYPPHPWWFWNDLGFITPTGLQFLFTFKGCGSGSVLLWTFLGSSG